MSQDIPDAIKLLLDHSDSQFGQLATVLGFVIDELKRQPGFKVDQFDNRMRELIRRFPEPEFDTLRMLLRMAAGDSPDLGAELPKSAT